MKNRRLRILAGALASSALLYAAAWFFAAARLKDEVTTAIETARERGVYIEAEWGDVSGFPFALTLPTAQWSLSTMSGIRWYGEGLAIRVRPWAPLTAEITLAGEHRVSALLRDRRTLSATIAGGAATLPMRADALSLRADRLDVSNDGAAPLSFENLSARLAVEPALPREPNLPSLRDWSQTGGRVLVEKARGRLVNADFTLNGWFGIDSDLRPTGQTRIELVSYTPLLRALAARGWIDGQNLPMIEVALAWLSVPDAKTGAPVLTLPLNAENGVLSFGPVTLAELQPIL